MMTHNEYNLAWYHQNKERVSSQFKARYAQNPDKILERNKKWRDSNKEKVNETKAKYRSRPEHYKLRAINESPEARQNRLAYKKAYRDKNREQIKQQLKTWYELNKHTVEFKGKMCASVIKRLQHIMRATPKWADLTEIKKFYMNRPEGYHVDHIIPLRAKNMCGLHVIGNLQYLPALENIKKGNKV